MKVKIVMFVMRPGRKFTSIVDDECEIKVVYQVISAFFKNEISSGMHLISEMLG